MPAPPEPAADRAANAAVRMHLCSSWAELEAHGRDWEHLLARTPSASIFVTPEWLGAWWRAFAPARRLMALLFFDSAGELVGLAPLYQDLIEGPWRVGLNRLRLVGDGSNDSDNLDFVLRPGHEQSCMQEFFSWIERQSDWHVCELNTLPSGSAAALWLRRGLEERRWVHEVHTHRRRVIVLPTSWEEYLAGLSSKERGKIGSYRRRLEAKYRVRIRRCADEAGLRADLDTLFELHRKRWERRGERGSFTGDARPQFYLDVARGFLARGWLEFWLLELDGKAVAAQFGFRHRDTVHSLQEGFDPAYFQESVGFVLRAEVLRQVIAEGARRYDFLAGDDPGKERWKPETWSYLDIHFARSASFGGRYLRLLHVGRDAREWLRSHLPPLAFAAARRIYHLLGLRAGA